MTGPAWETRQLLFVYGTLLLPTGEPDVDAAVGAGLPLGRGYIHGRLYDLGDYPGVKPMPADGSGPPPRVWGRLLGFSHPDPVFAALDRYEGFDHRSPLSSEFVRSDAAVFLPEADSTDSADSTKSTWMAQVYFYRPSIAGKPLIPSGDYLGYRDSRESQEGKPR